MPKIRSAKKALRQNIKHKVANTKKKRDMKVAVKAISKAASVDEKKKALSGAYKKIDKATKSFMHKNKAARLKSRLAKTVNKSK